MSCLMRSKKKKILLMDQQEETTSEQSAESEVEKTMEVACTAESDNDQRFLIDKDLKTI